MLGGEGAYTYKWTQNGNAAGYAATFTIPTTAKEGDVIAVTVTDEAGNTVADTVVVGATAELALERVEGAAYDANSNTYNVVIAYFNQPVEGLAAADVQIRRVSDDQLFAVESVALSSNGMKATITLANSSSAGASVTGLDANVDYNMIVSDDEGVASKVFYIPESKTDVSVVGIDPGNNKITINDYTASGMAPQTTLSVPADLDVDYEEILGRTVSVKYDKSNVITSLNVQDEDVVYGAFKVVNTAAAGDGCLEDLSTGIQYKSQAFVTAASSIHETSLITRKTGGGTTLVGGTTPTAQDFDNLATYVDGTEIAYAKLVLNSNGTVRVMQEELSWGPATNNVLVTKVNGTTVLGGTTEVSLKGYTIVEGGVTVTTDDIGEGDVVFYNTTDKFAEVYTYSETGELEAVYNNRFTFDGTTYDEQKATGNIKYQSRYVKSGGGLTNVDDDYMTALAASGEDITVYFDRAGHPVYVTGTLAEVKTSSVTVVLTDAPKTYTQSLVDYLRLKGFNGTEVATYDVDVSKLTSITDETGKTYKKGYADQNKGAASPAKNPHSAGFEAAAATAWANGAGVIKKASSGGGYTAVADVLNTTDLKQQSVITLTLDEDENVIGINYEDNANTQLGLALTAPATLTDGLKSITYSPAAGATVLQLAGGTPVYVYDAGNDTVAKMSYSDFAGSTAAANVHVFSYDEKNVKALEIAKGDIAGGTTVSTIEGVVAGVEHNPGSDNYMTYLKLVSGNAGSTDTEEFTTEYTKFAVNTIDTAKAIAVGDIVTIEVAADGATVNSVVENLPTDHEFIDGQAVVIKSNEKQTFNISDPTLTGDLAFATSKPATIVQIVNGAVVCVDFATFINESEKYLTNMSMLGGSVAYVDTAVVTSTTYNAANYAAAKTKIDALTNTELQITAIDHAVKTTPTAVKDAVQTGVAGQVHGVTGLEAAAVTCIEESTTVLTPTTVAGDHYDYSVMVSLAGYTRIFTGKTNVLT